MDTGIRIQGSIESAEMLEAVESHICKCGHTIKISAGFIIEGADMQYVEPDTKQLSCPVCNSKIELIHG